MRARATASSPGWSAGSGSGSSRSCGHSSVRRIRAGAARRRRREEHVAEQLAFEWTVERGGAGAASGCPGAALTQRRGAHSAGLSAAWPLRTPAPDAPSASGAVPQRRAGHRGLAEVAEGRVVRVAGWPISAQRPPTAKGMGFVVLEDETGRLPVALPPRLAAEMYRDIQGRARSGSSSGASRARCAGIGRSWRSTCGDTKSKDTNGHAGRESATALRFASALAACMLYSAHYIDTDFH